MEAHSGETLEDSVKDTYLNLCKTQVMSDMMPWGSSHLQTVETTDTIDSTVSVANTLTEYAYPVTNVPIEITGISVMRQTGGAYLTARRVSPFEYGDPEINGYSDSNKPVYFIRNNKIVVFPLFDAVVVDAIKVYMVEVQTNISATQTVTYVSDEFEKVWAAKGAEQYYAAGNDGQRALMMKGKYNELLNALSTMAPVPSRYSVK